MELEDAINLLVSREFTVEELKGDTLLAERVTAAREWVQASGILVLSQRALQAVKAERMGEECEAPLVDWVAQMTQEVERLGDRVLQLFASASAASTVH